MIWGDYTTIRASVQRSNRLSAYNTTEFAHLRTKFDRAFCINVLSVIPIAAARKRVLLFIRGKLRAGGTCLFVAQYWNSDFTRMRRLPNAQPHLDGFLIDLLRGYSFYGLISPEQLTAMVVNAGFEVVKQTLNESSVYLMVRSPRPSGPVVVMDEENNFQPIDRRRASR